MTKDERKSCESVPSWTNKLCLYVDTKAKCRHLKILTCGETLRQVFISLWTGDSQTCWYFRPSIVYCCPSPLLSSSTLPPPFPVWISILYTHIQCVRGGEYGFRPQTDKHLPQSPFTGNFFKRHFALPSIRLVFLRVPWNKAKIRRTHFFAFVGHSSY